MAQTIMKCHTKKLDFNKICRACLQEHSRLKNIFSRPLPTILSKLCPLIQVSEEDGLPSKICVACSNQILRFFTFKKKIEQNDRILHQYLNQKTESILEEFSDILDQAVSDAEIRRTIKVESSEEYITECDIQSHSSTVDVIKPQKCELLNEPPPLVPLESSTFGMRSDSVIIPELTKITPPPLVPIKPLSSLNPSDIVNALSDNIENPVQLNLKCNVCNEEFKSVYALKNHRMHQCQLNSMQCNICKKQIGDRNRLIGHLKGHMIAKDYCCQMCGKRYPNPSTFRVHMRTHTGERPFKCQVCNKGFVRWAGVVGHMKTHTASKPYKCLTCNKGFKVASNLERHKILHSNSLPFCCSSCGKTFSQSDNLRLHIRTYHTHERPYLCSECGKSFVSSTSLKRHMWIHTGYKPYRCRHCPKSYSNSNDRTNHENVHIGIANHVDKPYACNKCNMRFMHPCRLTKHYKTHERPYACTECSKTFSSQPVLNKHLAAKHNIIVLHELSNDLSVDEVLSVM